MSPSAVAARGIASDRGEGAPVPCPSPRRWPATLAALAALVVASGLLRREGQGFPLWSDEALSVGIASHPLVEIPALLGQDGSPPLYYVVLHQWMRWWGSSGPAIRSLSLLIALAAIPLAYWSGRSLFGRRVGWTAAALAATSTYLTLYSREARMYTLVAVLGLASAATFVHVFVFGRRRWLPAFVASNALLVLTHNWGLFLLAGAAVAAGWCAVAAGDQRRRRLVDAALGLGAAVVVWLPWLPTLLHQTAHTAAPWSRRPAAGSMAVALGSVLGGPLVALVVLAALVPFARAVWRDRRAPEHLAAVALGIMVLTTVVAAWVASRVEPAWSARYFGVFLGPLLVLVALALARSGRTGVAALAGVVVLGLVPVGRAEPKSNVEAVATQLAGVVRPGDVVLSSQMEQVPLLHYELGPALRYADPTGVVRDPTVADWRDVFERMRQANVATVLASLVGDLEREGHVVVVCPRPSATPDDLLWYRLMDLHCEAARRHLDGQPELARVMGPIPEGTSPEPPASVFAVVYELVADRR